MDGLEDVEDGGTAQDQAEEDAERLEITNEARLAYKDRDTSEVRYGGENSFGIRSDLRQRFDSMQDGWMLQVDVG